jgi:hypothetical protein
MPALHSREWLPLVVDPATPLFAFQRTGKRGDALVVILLNFSGTDVEAVADLPDETADVLGGSELTDLWSGDLVPAVAGGRVTASIPGWGFRFLTQAGHL